MAIKIVDVIDYANKLLRACQQLVAIGTITDTTLGSAKELGKALSEAAKFLNDQPFDTLRKSADKLETANLANANTFKNEVLGQVDLQAAPVEQPNKLQDLFATVSNSLIEAQKDLNDSSLQYASDLDPRLPQTLYGIPTVKAEMRVGFNEIRASGINLFLFTKSHQRQDFAESVVSFEVVGSPPPPGPAAYGDYLVPVPRFIVTGERRARILEKLKDKITGDLYDKNKKFAVVLRAELTAEQKEQRFFVQWVARQEADPPFPHWREISFVDAIETAAGELRFPTEKKESIFEFPPENGVFIAQPSTVPGITNKWKALIDKIADPNTSAADRKKAVEELKLQLDQSAEDFINLGDVAMNYNRLVYEWLDVMTYRPGQLNP